jgi:hypothetical protein
MKSTFALLVLALLGTACSDPPVVGEWQSDKKLGNGSKNQLSVFDDFTGEATVYATPIGAPDQWVKFRFNIDWEDEVDEFDLEMDCRGDACADDDFKMECEVIEEDDGDEKLDCTANKKWSQYPFNWERDLD